MFLRYQQVSRIIDLIKPKTIVEVGTWNGDHAVIMARAAMRHNETIHYWGLDLFENASDDLDREEFNVRSHHTLADVRNKLKSFQDSNPGFSFDLIPGNTRNTLSTKHNRSWSDKSSSKKYTLAEADFAYIDGGHSLATIKSDYTYLKNSKTIVFDDYYVQDEAGRCPDLSKVGCNNLLETINHMVLPARDQLETGGFIQMAATGDYFMERWATETQPSLVNNDKTSRTVVTTFNSEGYYSYGKRFIDSFKRFWPSDIKLKIYLESPLPINADEQIELLSFSKVCPEIIAFKSRHIDNPKARGFVGDKVSNYRFDAIKFSHKVFALTHCALTTETKILYWIDADTVFFKPISKTFLDKLLPAGSYTCYLGRRNRHSECGFMGFDLGHDANSSFMKFWKDIYDHDMVFDLPEWHDSYIYDIIRKLYQEKNLIVSFNIRDNYVDDHHPFINSPLAACMDHLISNRRKEAGCSFAFDLRENRDELYWKLVPYMPEDLLTKSTDSDH